MGLPLLAGSLLIALGPPAIFLVTTVSRRPYLIIALLFGLLHGIASMLIGGVVHSIWNIWTTPSSLVLLLLNIFTLELLRPFAYQLIATICEKLNRVNIPLSLSSPTEVFKLSVCYGLGIGFLNGLSISLVPLTSAGQNADFYAPHCNCMSIYILVALECLLLMPMHVAWTYYTMSDYPTKSNSVPLIITCWHIIVGVSTLFPSCIVTLIVFSLSALLALILTSRKVAASAHLMKPVKKES
ncbi:hypothetical protein WA556_001179, partial [Blastocystis sp. ATCC 50177/Nand II]